MVTVMQSANQQMSNRTKINKWQTALPSEQIKSGKHSCSENKLANDEPNKSPNGKQSCSQNKSNVTNSLAVRTNQQMMNRTNQQMANNLADRTNQQMANNLAVGTNQKLQIILHSEEINER